MLIIVIPCQIFVESTKSAEKEDIITAQISKKEQVQFDQIFVTIRGDIVLSIVTIHCRIFVTITMASFLLLGRDFLHVLTNASFLIGL